MTRVENKSAYPYITQFKKEPFSSFALKKSGEIRSFFLSSYDEVLEIFNYWINNLLTHPNLDLEKVYWFLLLKKYLKQDISAIRDEIYKFILRCEVNIIDKDQIGFKSSPSSNSIPDVWSSYFALISLNILGEFGEFMSLRGPNENQRRLLNFINAHSKGNRFIHCLDKNCDKTGEMLEEQTFYYVIELYSILGIDLRLRKDKYKSFLTEKKKETALIFKLLSIKFFDLDFEVKEKALEYLYHAQKPDGGYSYDFENSDVQTTFWMVNVLENYSWLIDYNPAQIYSYVMLRLDCGLKNAEITQQTICLRDLSQLVIILSLIWSKFIEEIERVLFQRLEEDGFIDVEQLKAAFGLNHGIEEIITYINLSYNVQLKIIDNSSEFEKLISDFSQGKKVIIEEVYTQLKNNSIISLSDIFKRYKSSYHYESLKLKEDVFPILTNLIEKHFFTGEIRAKKGFLLRTKYYLFLDFLYEKIIVSDRIVESEKLFEEKARLKEVKNDIYNMILKLKTTVPQIKEEIASYLYLDEINYAKERLRFVLRNALMEADFLNENIESSFNQNLRYINLQAVLASDIKQWNNAYSLLKIRLNELNSYFQEKIKEKEELIKISLVLDELEGKINEIQEHITRELDNFKNYVADILEEGYSEDKFNLVINAFTIISNYMSKSDNAVYRISHQIISSDKKVIKKHKRIIDTWVKFKESYDVEFIDYTTGFEFFNKINADINSIKDEILAEISKIKQGSVEKVKTNQFQEAFDLINSESDTLLSRETHRIKEIKGLMKKEGKFKQKLYPFYKYLFEKLDSLEESVLELIAQQVESLRDKILEERNKAKIKEFDDFIINSIQLYKSKIEKLKNSIDISKIKKIDDIDKIFNDLKLDFEAYTKKFQGKYNEIKQIIENYEENFISVKQFENFMEYFQYEIENIKEDITDQLISDQVIVLSKEENSDTIDIKKLSNKVNIKCKQLLPRIKDLVEISKIHGELLEEKKELIVHTEDFYKHKELRNFTEKKVLKGYQEAVGKILALYDSCIKNKTLNVNFLEIKNRISDAFNLQSTVLPLFENKVKELSIDEKRIENRSFKTDIEAILKNNQIALENIRENLVDFKELQVFIDHEYGLLQLELEKVYSKLLDDVTKIGVYDKLKEIIEDKTKKLEEKTNKSEILIIEKLKSTISMSYESKKFEPEIREYYVKQKTEFNKLFQYNLTQIEEKINVQKFEKNRNLFINSLNKKRVHLSQLLGTMQSRIDDFIETEQFKRAYIKVIKRQKAIEDEMKNINKEIKNLIKDYTKQTRDFESRNKLIIDDFQLFLKEFNEILREKINMAEESILNAYILMAIKAVANEYLTLSFLQNELKIKKQQIQHHIISLISSGKLSGKYDPTLGIYYENPDAIKGLNENELEVIKKMNFRFYMFYNQFRNFTKQNYTIFTFLAALLSITLSLSSVMGGNPLIYFILIISVAVVIAYIYFKKRKAKKV